MVQYHLRVLPFTGPTTLTCMIENFNADCKRDGSEYEEVVLLHEINNNKAEVLGRNVMIPGSGVEVDAILMFPGEGGAIKFIQAKGGKPGKSKRPGAQRTDSVKKAIADGTLIKSVIPDSYYIVYFSERPKEGSHSEDMINSAIRSGYLDEVRYLSYAG